VSDILYAPAVKIGRWSISVCSVCLFMSQFLNLYVSGMHRIT